MLLKNVHPFIAEILDGQHDEILSAVEQAVRGRRKDAARKSGIRPGAKVRVADHPSNGRFAGMEGIVRKINPKSISVDLACPTCGSATEVAESVGALERCDDCFGLPSSLSVPGAALLEVIA